MAERAESDEVAIGEAMPISIAVGQGFCAAAGRLSPTLRRMLIVMLANPPDWLRVTIAAQLLSCARASA